jgi:hypothetical protein
MKYKKRLFTTGIFLLGFAFYFSGYSSLSFSEEALENTEEDLKSADQNSIHTKIPEDSKSVKAENDPLTAEIQNPEQDHQNQELKKQLNQIRPPGGTEFRKEVRSNPHSHPASMGRFAESLVFHVERGLSLKSYSANIFEFLEKCATGENGFGDETSHSVMAHCLVQAYKLADKYPDIFSEKLATLTARVHPNVLRLANILRD